MGRARGSTGPTKRKISLSVDEALLVWAEENAGAGRRFATVSHAVETALARLVEAERDDADLLAAVKAARESGDMAKLKSMIAKRK